MNFRSAVTNGLSRWKDFRGAAGRSEYWWFQLFLVIANFAILVVGFALTIALGQLGAVVMIIAFSLLWLISLFPALSLSVRRLRDGGFSWALIFLALVPGAGVLLLVFFLLPTRTEGPRKPALPKESLLPEPVEVEELEPVSAEPVQAKKPKSASRDVESQLERLTALLAEGKITETQFDRAKSRLESE